MEIVLSTHWSNRLFFYPEHIAWFKTKGYSDSDIEAFNENRSHPDLIACIKAVREQSKVWSAEAQSLWDNLMIFTDKVDADSRKFNDELALMEDFIRDKRYNTDEAFTKIMARVKYGYENALSYEEFCQKNSNIARSTNLSSFGSIYRELFQLFAIWKTSAENLDRKRAEHLEFCSNHHLNPWGSHEFAFSDNMSIKYYDENLFEAEIEQKETTSTQYETLKLLPYVRVSDIEQFVANGDSKSIIEHLRKLGVVKIV